MTTTISHSIKSGHHSRFQCNFGMLIKSTDLLLETSSVPSARSFNLSLSKKRWEPFWPTRRAFCPTLVRA